MKQITIMIDNGGGIQLQTAKFCHNYDSGADAARDIRQFVAGVDTSDWDGNEPEFRRDPVDSDITLNAADCAALIRAGKVLRRLASGYAGMEMAWNLLGKIASSAIRAY